jgi:hypothetical protein
LEFDPKFIEGTGTSPQALLTFHREAGRFPMMGNEEFDQLVDNIKEIGLQNPITVCEGQILDGRNRYLACIKAGVLPEFVEFKGKDPVAFVYAVNVQRRHLTVEQKLDLVAKLLTEFPERSDRGIARLAQVHHKTVGRVRAQLEAGGAGRHVEARVDSKGRCYPVHRERKAPVAPVSLIEPDDAEPESWVLACARALRRGDTNRTVNELLDILGAEKKRITALPKTSRSALVRRFLAVVDITLDDLRPIISVPVMDGALLRELSRDLEHAENGEEEAPSVSEITPAKSVDTLH